MLEAAFQFEDGCWWTQVAHRIVASTLDHLCLSPQPIQPSLNQPTDSSTGVADYDAQQTTYHVHEHFTTLYVLASSTPLLFYALLLFLLLLLLLLLPFAVAFRH